VNEVGFFDWLFGGRNREAEDADLDAELAHWQIAEIESEDGAVVLARVRLERPDLPDLAQYTTAVSVSWPIVDDAVSPEMSAAMDEFETSMDEFESFSYLIQVRTGLGERNWLFYTPNGDRLTTVIRSRQATHGWPLTIETTEDPNWDEWRMLAERLTRGTAQTHS
jgi:hypothetical protein